jgi:RHS repeat-associated protein
MLKNNHLSRTFQDVGGIGGLLARSEPPTLNPQLSTALYHSDGNGNITALVTTSGTVAAKYHYDPYGNLLSMAGPLADANLHRFSSKEWHEKSGLVYYLYRYYEPKLQRWVNRDPTGERSGINLFVLTSNHPCNAIDPFGLNEILVNSNCKGHDLSGFTYLAESEPPSEKDRRDGHSEGEKRLRNLPEPGQQVLADAIYYPGGAMKIGHPGSVVIDCKSGKPEIIDNTTHLKGDGAKWKYGEPKPDGWFWSWPGDIKPYEQYPPGPIAPPLNPTAIPPLSFPVIPLHIT